MTTWFPQDEGQVGQAAERFLGGEWPHRDFDDMYTGLLTVLHAASFLVLGVRTESTRWMLLVACIPFLLGVYRVSRRWLSHPGAGGMVILCGFWSVRLNPESLPSWYILFLTVWLLDALLRFSETGRLRSVFTAGLFAGTAILFKITGIYLIAAGVLFLMDCEQRGCPHGARRSLAFSAWNILCVLVYLLAASRLWSPSDPVMSALHLTIPALLPGIAVLSGEWRFGRGAGLKRLGNWLRLQLSFLCGAALPLMCWLLLYFQRGALQDLYEGVVLLPQRRLEFAGAAFPGLSGFLLAGVAGTIVFAGFRRAAAPETGRLWSGQGRLFPILLPLLLLALGCWSDQGRLVCFQIVRNLGPYVAVALLALSHLNGGRPAVEVRVSGGRSADAGGPAENSVRESSRAFAVATTLVMGSMVQFPFALDHYFLYVAPLVFLGSGLVLAMAAPAAKQEVWGPLQGLVLGLCLFAFPGLTSVVPLGGVIAGSQRFASLPLQLDRCGLTVERSLGSVYQRLVETIRRHTGVGEAILAGPDSPEVYFLSARRNPTRVFYEFFRPEFLQDRSQLQKLADREGIRLVVVKQPFLREFSQDAGELEVWARERFGEPLALRFSSEPDSAGPVLFNVYSDHRGVKAGELARRE
ncbi:MAG: hypothetical protein ACKO2P_08020 [Planctomycetota bacterium]